MILLNNSKGSQLPVCPNQIAKVNMKKIVRCVLPSFIVSTIALLVAAPIPALAEITGENLVEEDLFDLSLKELSEIQVETASRIPERLSDTPVAVTVITSEMIANSGAQSIKRLLTSFVPGFTAVEDQNELNVAARGIYTSSQQKILFLLDGHRLNSHSYSMAAPDFTMSLDKIEQIEVLRGPASAVYGNVALTAVINIIPKKGQDHSGSFAKVAVGEYGAQTLSYHFGHKGKHDFFGWVNHNKTDGQVVSIEEQDVFSASPQQGSEALVGAQKELSSYDIGSNYQGDNWGVLVNARRGHYVEPFSAGGLSGEPYPYDQYETVGGYSPGFGYEAQHIRTDYSFELSDQWRYYLDVGLNRFLVKASVVTNPAALGFAYVGWTDTAVGTTHILERSVEQSSLQLGIQYDRYRVFDDELKVGTGGIITTDVGNLMQSGSEAISSVFAQYKKYWSENWITNIGFRSDQKDRAVTDDVNAFSPRLALIYREENASLKISYAESFVDSTYWNRFSNLSTFRGANDLKPEQLSTFQITPSIKLPELNLKYNGTVFYNKADDFIRRDISALATEANFSNAGEFTSWGVEQELVAVFDQGLMRMNITWQRVIDAENFPINDGEIANVPSFTLNLVGDYKFNRKVSIHGTLQYIGEQYSPINIVNNGVAVPDPFPGQGVEFDDPNNRTESVALLHSQLSYLPMESLRLDLQIENVFDTEYFQGGATLHPYPQTGRWIKASIGYRF